MIMCSFFRHTNTLFFVYLVYIKRISSEWKKLNFVFIFLQKLKIPARIQNSDFKQQQKYPLTWSKTWEILSQKTVHISLHSQS